MLKFFNKQILNKEFVMRKILVAIGSICLLVSFAVAGNVDSNCQFKGKVLKGKVKVVDSFPDFKVKVVDSFQDLKVKKKTSFPDKCGEWQFVDSFPDFTIKFVDSFPDFTIKYVDSFPGVK